LLYKKIAIRVAPAIWIQLQDALAQYNKEVMATKGGISRRVVGFFSERAYVRSYPTGKLAASLIGFTNDAGMGAAGVESSLEPILAGTNGQYVYENGAGTVIPGSAKIQVEAKPGTSVKLTIDRDINGLPRMQLVKLLKRTARGLEQLL